MVATQAAVPLDSLEKDRVRSFITRADPECSRDPNRDGWRQHVPEEIWLKLQLFQLAARSSGSAAGRLGNLEDMDWREFVRFLLCLVDESGPTKERISEGQEIWDRFKGDDKAPLDPRNIHGLAMRTGEALTYAKNQGFTEEQEREVVTYVLRRMKEANARNPTLQKLTDDLKAEEEHNKGLRHFLTAVLKKVAKQAEELNSFRRSNLMSFLNGPAKNVSEDSTAKTSASLGTADPKKEKKDRKRGRSEAPNENRNGNKNPKKA